MMIVQLAQVPVDASVSHVVVYIHLRFRLDAYITEKMEYRCIKVSPDFKVDLMFHQILIEDLPDMELLWPSFSPLIVPGCIKGFMEQS